MGDGGILSHKATSFVLGEGGSGHLLNHFTIWNQHLHGVVYYHESECHVRILDGYLQDQGH